MIEEIKRNIETEIGMLRELVSYSNRLSQSRSKAERNLLLAAIKSLRLRIKLVNESLPELLRDISLSKKLPAKGSGVRTRESLENLKLKTKQSDVNVVLRSRDKAKFLEELSISESFVKKIKKHERDKQEIYFEFKASRGYLKFANKIFLKKAKLLVEQGKFKPLALSIRRANIDILLESYIALIYLTVVISAVLAVCATVFFFFFNVVAAWPIFVFYEGGRLVRIAKIFWIPFAVPMLTFLLLYVYPSTEQKSLEKKINQEIPFAVLHMSAITGSGIEPSEIFRIIGLSREYPYLRKEIRKVLNQINLYGYDLTTALGNAAKASPSEKLAELFDGLSVSITSGASLSEFFEKRSETLLASYRLEREKYTKTVETFLDIYISVVITAPLIFLLLIVMIAISGIDVGLSAGQISTLSVVAVALLNILFLVFLQVKQPSY